MGRELRRVPPDWEHPLLEDQSRYRHPNGWDWTGQGRHFRPLFDEDYETALQEWWEGRQLWKMGEHPDQGGVAKEKGWTWEQWAGRAPDPDDYRPAWTAEQATHFQIYETVSEGTPVSPVLPTREAVHDWLVGQGYTHDAAAAFAEDGWVPSMIKVDGRLYRGIEAAAIQKNAT